MVYRLLILSFSFLLFSCGTRKVDLNKTETLKTTQTKEQYFDSSNVKIKFDINREIYTITANDTLKPFVYDGKTYFNAVLRKELVKDNIVYENKKKIAYIKDNKVITRNITKTKYITRTNYIAIYIILIIIIIYILYRLYKYITKVNLN